VTQFDKYYEVTIASVSSKLNKSAVNQDMYQEIKYYAKDEPEKLPETEIHNTFKTFGRSDKLRYRRFFVGRA
jgi:hypothetical protein